MNLKKRLPALLLAAALVLSLPVLPIHAADPVDYLPPDPEYGMDFYLQPPSVEGRLTLSEDAKTATLFAPGTTRDSGWMDADKNWGNDASLCWAASCSNLLAWYIQTAEREGRIPAGTYENNHDRIFDQFRSAWPAMAGQDPVAGLSWYFTGGFPSGGPPAYDPPTPGSGGFLRGLYPGCDQWSKLNFQQPAHYLYGDYATMMPFLDSEDGSYYDYQPLATHRSFSDTIIRQLHYGPTCLTVGKENAGPQTTHAVTMWGCDYDAETHLVTAIYLTDSDDSQDLLRRIRIKARPGDTGGILMQGFYPMVSGDQREFTAIVCSDLLFPYGSVSLEAPAPDPLFEIVAANMVMGNNLDLMFAIPGDARPDWSGCYAELVRSFADGRPAQTLRLDASQWASGGPYQILTYPGLAAKEMGDTITVTVYDAAGQPVSKPYADSIRSYALRLLDKSAIPEQKTLLVDMLNYGAAAQARFGYAAEDPVNGSLTPEQRELASDPIPFSSRLDRGELWAASNLVLESNIRLMAAFRDLTPDMTATVEFTNHMGRPVSTVIPGTDFQSVGSLQAVVIEDLVVADARIPVTITIRDADGSIVTVCQESIEDYLARMNAVSDLFSTVMKFADSAHTWLHRSDMA